MRDITLSATKESRAVQFGPRVEREGGHVEQPAPGEAPQFYGVYVAGRRGGWQWFTDARDAESARAIAPLVARADIPGAQRRGPEDLTIAYIAHGVSQWIAESNPAGFEDWEGELGFMQAVIDKAAFVDRVGDYYNDEGHPGVFAYEVAEEFGKQFAEALYHGTFAQQDEALILRGIMEDAQYPNVEEAIAYVKSH